MIKEYLEQTIKSIETEKEKKVAEIKARLMQEKIAPFNAEVDEYRAKALTELDAQLNQKIAVLKQEYEAKKQELVKLGEEKKKANADTVLASDLAVVTVEFDKHINKLKAQIAEIKE